MTTNIFERKENTSNAIFQTCKICLTSKSETEFYNREKTCKTCRKKRYKSLSINPDQEKLRIMSLVEYVALSTWAKKKANKEAFEDMQRDEIATHATKAMGFTVVPHNLKRLADEMEIPWLLGARKPRRVKVSVADLQEQVKVLTEKVDQLYNDLGL